MTRFPYRNENERREDRECAAAGSHHQLAAYVASPPMNNYSHYSYNGHQNNADADANVFYSTSESESVDTHSNSVSTSLLVGTFYNPSETDSFSMEENHQSVSMNGMTNSLSYSQSQNASAQQTSPAICAGHSWKGVFDNHDAFGHQHDNIPRVIENPEVLTKPHTLENPLGNSSADEHVMRRKRLLWAFTFLLVCILVLVAVSMGVVIGAKRTEKRQNSQGDTSQADAFVAGETINNQEQPSLSPSLSTATVDDSEGGGTISEESETDTTGDQVEGQEEIASTFNTDTPSGRPTAAAAAETVIESAQSTPTASPGPPSTTQSINAFVRLLPTFTLDALENPISVQSRALHWLTADPALPTYSEARLFQRYALATFYFATNGGNDEIVSAQWLGADGWLSYEQHECTWYTTVESVSGNPCRQGLYTHLSLRRNNLQGTLPPEISFLAPQLEVLDLELNTLKGPLPSQIGLFTNLRRLVVRANDFSGWVPTEIGALTQLLDLQLENNDLTGTITSELGMLQALKNMTLGDNLFTSSIPTHLASLSSLEIALLHGNQLTGPIPSELGKLQWLQSLSLRSNLLSGTLPTELGLLSNLERLLSHQNLLRGPLPSEIGSSTQLKMLSLSRNGLTGTLPTSLGRLTLLEDMWLFENQLTGPMPSELGLLTDLVLLPVRDNALTGSVPSEVCSIIQRSVLEVTVDCNELACDCGCTCAIQGF